MDIQSTKCHLLKILQFFPHFSAVLPLSQIKCPWISEIAILLRWSVCLSLHKIHSLNLCCFRIRLISGKKNCSLVACQQCLGCLWPLCFHTYFRISILISAPPPPKKAYWNFYWSCVEFIDKLQRIDNFTMLTLPSYEHGLCSHVVSHFYVIFPSVPFTLNALHIPFIAWLSLTHLQTLTHC